MRLASKLYSRPWLMAGIAAAAVILWVASGSLGGEETAQGLSGETDAGPARVQVRTQRAEQVTRFISVYGRTAPARVVQIKAETSGRVEAFGAARGEQVKRGTLMLRLDLRDREARLEQAKAGVEQYRTAYEGQLELKTKGYVSDTQLAETLAKLEGAKTELKRAELDLEYMTVRAPFDGVIHDRSVEIGDFVRAADPLLDFVDNTRLIVTGSIAEQDARHVRVGHNANAKLVTGQLVKGRIRYIAPVADEGTRTFTVELEVANAGGKLPSGVTAEMQLPAGQTLAQKVSPAILSLAADGQIGVKTVDDNGHVYFSVVEIVRSEPDGVWVSGLPATANIIVVGQGYVSAGQKVEAVFVKQETAMAQRAQSSHGTLQ